MSQWCQFCLFFGTFLASSLPAQPLLVGLAQDNEKREVLSFDGEIVVSNGERYNLERTGGWSWQFDDFLEDSMHYFAWSPLYSISKLTTNPADSVGPYLATVTLLGESEDSDHRYSTLEGLWPRGAWKGGLIVVVWLADEMPVEVRFVSAPESVRSLSDWNAQIQLELSAVDARGHPAIMLLTTQGWVPPKARMRGKQIAAYHALMSGNEELLGQELANGVDPLTRSKDGVSLLTFAAEMGDSDIVTLLVEHMKEREISSPPRWLQASTWAAAKGRREAISALMAANINFKGDNAWDENPIRMVLAFNHLSSLSLLRDFVDSDSIPYLQILSLSAGNLNAAKIFQGFSSESQITPRDLSAMLYSKVRANDSDSVRWLLDHGITTGVVHNASGKIAVEYGDSVFSRDLRDYTTFHNTTGAEDPLIVAILENFEVIALMLIEAGWDPNVSSQNGIPALSLAAAQGNETIVKALVQGGADLNELASENLRTALHFGVLSGSRDVCQILVDSGAQLDLASAQHLTPLELAWSVGELSIVELLHSKNDLALRNRGMLPELVDQCLVADRADLLAILLQFAERTHLHLNEDLFLRARLADATACQALLSSDKNLVDDLRLITPRQLFEKIELVSSIPPIDPRVGLKNHPRVVVNVGFVIDIDGSVVLPTVQGKASAQLASAALTAVKAWKFKKLKFNGQPARVRVSVPVVFKEKQLREYSWDEVDTPPSFEDWEISSYTRGRGRIIEEYSIGANGEVYDCVVLFADDFGLASARMVQLKGTSWTPAKLDERNVATRFVRSWERD